MSSARGGGSKRGEGEDGAGCSGALTALVGGEDRHVEHIVQIVDVITKHGPEILAVILNIESQVVVGVIVRHC